MAYQAFASYYDRLIGNEVDYRARARYFDALIRRYADTPEQNLLLDLACGTGSLSVELSAIGYDVIGRNARRGRRKGARKNFVSLPGV